MGLTKGIADGIVSFLNDSVQQASFNTTFEATRENLPIHKKDELDDELHVFVFAGPRSVLPVTSRKSIGKNFQFLVGIVQAIETQAEEDVLIELGEQIENALFSEAGFELGGGKRLESSELTTPAFVPEELEKGVMAVFIPVTYYAQVLV